MWYLRMHPNRFKQTTSLWLAALLTLIAYTYLIAKESDKQQPVVVTADRSQYSEKSQQQTLIGNVRIVQGSLKIYADKIVIYLKNGALERIDASGKPTTFEQLNDTDQQIKAQANRIEYVESSGQVVFTGDARLISPQQTLSGDSIDYTTTTQAAMAKMDEGGNQQINIVIQPASAQ